MVKKAKRKRERGRERIRGERKEKKKLKKKDEKTDKEMNKIKINGLNATEESCQFYKYLADSVFSNYQFSDEEKRILSEMSSCGATIKFLGSYSQK